MSTEIYYFSGTGNSLHAAKELQKRIPEADLIPFVSLTDKQNVKTEGKNIGFVFPIHFMTCPGIVKKIIKKMDLSTAEYIFIVATRYGTPCKVMFSKFSKLLENKGKRLNAFLTLNMASNDPKFKDWKPAADDELEKFEAELQDRLDLLKDKVINHEDHLIEDTSVTFPVDPKIEPLLVNLIEILGDGKEKFYANSDCTGCGICEKVCLSGKIKQTDDTPVWQKGKDCYSCYACLNFCPVKAIQLKSSSFIKYYTDINGRYCHAEATIDDIADQKLWRTI